MSVYFPKVQLYSKNMKKIELWIIYDNYSSRICDQPHHDVGRNQYYSFQSSN